MAIIEELYFALPFYISNMTPVFVKKLNILNYPINKKLFGENKTVRGFVSAILISILFFYIQSYLFRFDFIKKISLIDYSQINIFLIGFLGGLGTIGGDLIKSFFKRRRKIKPGESWIPFDQLDFMFGALLLINPLVKLRLGSIVILFIITPILHISANHIGYYLGLRNTKW